MQRGIMERYASKRIQALTKVVRNVEIHVIMCQSFISKIVCTSLLLSSPSKCNDLSFIGKTKRTTKLLETPQSTKAKH